MVQIRQLKSYVKVSKILPDYNKLLHSYIINNNFTFDSITSTYTTESSVPTKRKVASNVNPIFEVASPKRLIHHE